MPTLVTDVVLDGSVLQHGEGNGGALESMVGRPPQFGERSYNQYHPRDSEHKKQNAQGHVQPPIGSLNGALTRNIAHWSWTGMKETAVEGRPGSFNETIKAIIGHRLNTTLMRKLYHQTTHRV